MQLWRLNKETCLLFVFTCTFQREIPIKYLLLFLLQVLLKGMKVTKFYCMWIVLDSSTIKTTSEEDFQLKTTSSEVHNHSADVLWRENILPSLSEVQ